jgi:hypothetical protein
VDPLRGESDLQSKAYAFPGSIDYAPRIAADSEMPEKSCELGNFPAGGHSQ